MHRATKLKDKLPIFALNAVKGISSTERARWLVKRGSLALKLGARHSDAQCPGDRGLRNSRLREFRQRLSFGSGLAPILRLLCPRRRRGRQ